jgi:hypothetical protein
VHFVLSAHIQRLLSAFNAEDMCGSATMFGGLIAMARRQKMFEPVADPLRVSKTPNDVGHDDRADIPHL